MNSLAFRGLVVAWLFLSMRTASLAGPVDEDRAFLLQGVKSIHAPGVPGPLTVFGEDAFVVTCGGADRGMQEPVVAAARWRRGRVVAFGHGGYFGEGSLQTGDTGVLMANSVRWAGVGGPDQSLRVAVVGLGGLQTFLKGQGHDVLAIDRKKLESLPAGIDVICMDAGAANTLARRQAVSKFVRAGGGLVTASLAWGWKQLNPGRDLATDHDGNQLLAPAGLMWADGYLKRTHEHGYTVQAPPEECHALRALELLATQAERPGSVDRKIIEQAGVIVLHAARTAPDNDRLILPRLKRLEREYAGSAIPAPEEPLNSSAALQRVLLAMQLDAISELPAQRVKAHPAASAFPGNVPRDARRIEKSITVDTSVPGWRSTGLYAPAGGMVVVSIDAEAAGGKLGVRIGAHTDRLWHKPSWRRAPAISRRWELSELRTVVASAFGGLVYIDVPKNCTLGEIAVTIGGGVQAPLFVRGETSLDDWRKTIRDYPAPWAELATKKVIITVPSAVVRSLDDPEALMDHWDRAMDACAELAARPMERKRPERYVTDVQISAGYMHAGYPIMTGLDVAPKFVDLQSLAAGDGVWGFYHEMGHNHQHRDWTFGGTGEVTCNLFSLYLLETLSGITEGHGGLSQENVRRSRGDYFATGTPFSVWKSNPFLALQMYVQLRDEFGWETYRNVFTEYRSLSDGERPKNDDQKRDQWMVRFSRAAGRNLGPFFEAWGVPTSTDARRSIEDLPVWMPANFPPSQ